MHPVTIEKAAVWNRHHIISGPPLCKPTSPVTQKNFYQQLFSRSIEEMKASSTTIVKGADIAFASASSFTEETTTAYGWSIQSTSSRLSDGGIITGRHVISTETQSLAGLLALTHCLTLFPDLPSKVYLAVSQKNVKDTVTDVSPVGVTDMIAQDYDLRQEIRQAILTLQRKVELVVISAQDTVPKEYEAALSAAMVEANQAARRCASDLTVGGSITTLAPLSQAYILREGKLVAGNFRALVREDIYRDSLQETIIKTEKWSETTFHKVSWKAFAMAFKKVSRVRRITYTKLTHQLLQTNSRNHRFYGSSATCPSCKQSKETLAHVFSCPSEESTAARAESLVTYEASLADIGTHEAIIKLFIQGLSDWCLRQQGKLNKQEVPHSDDPSHKTIAAIYEEQTKLIGWEPFLRGRVSSSWGRVYSIYYPTAGTHEIETWLSDVIRTNWDLALSLWHHRNGIVHGSDTREAERKLRTKLHKEVPLKYKLYESDPFIISRSQSFLFESASKTAARSRYHPMLASRRTGGTSSSRESQSSSSRSG